MKLKPAFQGLFAILLIIASCNPETKEIPQQIETIIIDISSKELDSVLLSSMVEDIEYIKLEATPDSYITFCEETEIGEKYIVVLRKQSIYVFNRKGKYLNRIGRKGKGPGEYTFPRLLRLSKDEKYLFFHDSPRRKILQYELDGTFISETEIHFYPTNVRLLNTNIPIFFNSSTMNHIYDSITLFTINNNGLVDKKILSKCIPVLMEEPGTFYVADNLLNNYYDSLTYWEEFCDTIYRVSPDYTVIPKYLLDIKEFKMPIEVILNSERNIIEIHKYFELIEFTETKDYIFIFGHKNYKLNRIIYDKNKRISRNLYFDENSYSGRSLINDFDGGYPIFPSNLVNPKTLFVTFDVNSYKTQLQSGYTKTPDKIKYPEKQKQFQELLDNADENDNPVIMIVHLK